MVELRTHECVCCVYAGCSCQVPVVNNVLYPSVNLTVVNNVLYPSVELSSSDYTGTFNCFVTASKRLIVDKCTLISAIAQPISITLSHKI